ncbi:MAG: hypothetical protein DRJ50_11660 [Actinobacteria bacterium]|nr:MAG: hypothetical protein DRJ50_11660 [Actinomycetota bacterium]
MRQSATSLNLIGETGTGVLARRSQQFAFPTSVWFPDERQLLPAIAAPFTEVPLPAPEHLALRDVIEAAGAVATVEHGVVFGEVRGLEVCRVVDQPTVGLFSELSDVSSASAETLLDTGGAAGLAGREYEGVQLEVGVGVNDREAFRLLHGNIPTVEALRGVVETVEAHRTVEAQQHPLNRLAQERFLRWRLGQEPALIGASEVVAAEPPVARPNLKDPVPCVATAVADGRPAIVVCSTGVDLDLVPFVADVQAMYDDPVIIVAPKRDLVPITNDLASLLNSPVELRSIN